MVHNPGAFGRAYLTKDERKTLSRDEKKSLRSERKAQVKAQAPGSRKGFLAALKTAAGVQQQGFAPGAEGVAAGETVVFDPGTSTTLVPGVPNWALATGALLSTAAAVGAVVYFRRRRAR